MRYALVCAALALAACQTAPYCLTCERSEGGFVDGEDLAGDAGLDLTLADLATPPDLTETHPCDSAMTDSDPYNCGACGNVCSHAHAIPSCINGGCVVNCDVGWVDLDHDPSNDCEYQCLATGAEICDELDNDCNGVIDDGFDKNTDVLNCGTCGNTCTAPNGVVTCSSGTCSVAGCTPGYADLDSSAPGCEYHCPVYPPLAFEVCNGVDDNCDGNIDEAAVLEPAPVGLCTTTVGTPCAGTTASCRAVNGITTWYCNYGAGVEFDPTLPNGIVDDEKICDNLDGDCDGNPDDPFTDVGNACDNGLFGACRDVGQIICDPMDRSKTKCDFSVLPDPVPGAPMSETCNGVDDDCDGFTDERTGGGRLVQDMVHVQVGPLDFYIDRYEASRPDATSGSAGTSAATSCSKPNALPWTQVTFDDAQAACATAGFHLCSKDEWTAACAGAGATTYPYGNAYQGATCNGADFAATHAVAPTGEAALAMCVSANGVHDLSGNVKEWTNDQQGSTSDVPPIPIYTTRGGAYGSPSIGLTCATTFAAAAETSALADVGFRCCSSTAP